MSEHKHTTGEWTQHISSQDEPRAVTNGCGDCWVSQHLVFGVGDKIIGEVSVSSLPSLKAGYPHVANTTELWANMHLILAAPKMFAALELLADHAAFDFGLGMDDEVTAVFAAIDAAKGESDAG